ncbi:hypothetical protein SRHO_G00155570 [Serrasalmus rhombeus]
MRSRFSAKTRLAATLFTLSSLPSMLLGCGRDDRVDSLGGALDGQQGHLNQGMKRALGSLKATKAAVSEEGLVLVEMKSKFSSFVRDTTNARAGTFPLPCRRGGRGRSAKTEDGAKIALKQRQSRRRSHLHDSTAAVD